MNYSIGLVAKTFGFTKEALRFYEREGVLTPTRDENGYRYYTSFQLQRVAVIKRMQNIGFSLREIAAMLADYSETRLFQNLDICIEKRERTLAYQQALLDRLREDAAFFQMQDNYDRAELVEVPERFALYFDDVDKLVGDQHIRADVLHWYDRMYPALGLETVAVAALGQEQLERRIGLVADRQAALASGLEKTENIEVLKPCCAVRYCARLTLDDGNFLCLRRAFDEAAQTLHVTYQGLAHVVFNFSYRGGDGHMVYLIRAYAPVCGEA